jgi:hypothetical protein
MTIAFSSEVGTGSRKENASNQDHRAQLLILFEAEGLSQTMGDPSERPEWPAAPSAKGRVASEYVRYKEKSDALEIDEANGSMRIHCARRMETDRPWGVKCRIDHKP